MLLNGPHLGSFAVKGGDLSAVKAPGLPNITGAVQNIAETFAYFGQSTDDSALYHISQEPVANQTPQVSDVSLAGTMGFDASRSNNIYGTSDTVQMPALQLLPQFKI